MSGLDSIGLRARRGERLNDVLIIDVHGHVGDYFAFPTAPHADAEALLRGMDRIGIACLCLSGHAGVGVDFGRGNDACIRAVRRHPGRFFGYITVSPIHASGLLPEILRCEAPGMRALKIHSAHGRPYTAPEYQPVFRHAEQQGYPVLAHTWGGELGALRELAPQYPRIRWILAHSGVVQFDDYVTIGRDFENVYLDLCASAAGYGVVERFVADVGAHKVLFGSDAGFLSAAQQIGRVALARITEEEKRAVLGLNAQRVLGLASVGPPPEGKEAQP